jgi:hypothetical protein
MKMKRRFWLITLILGLGLLVGACAPMMGAQDEIEKLSAPAATQEAEYADYEGVVEETFIAEEAPEGDRSTAGSGNGTASVVERMVVYNADLFIAVEDPDAALKTITQMAAEAGGFVVASNIFQSTTSSGASLPRATLTVRVPAEDLDAFLSEIRQLTPNPDEDVISESVSGQDVTAEYTDLSSRLTNLEAAESALVELMAEAEDPEDVLAIFDELTYYRGEIELVKGRMQYLEESAALSSISVEIVAKESLQPIEIAGWTPRGTARRAVESLINTLQLLGDAAIWFGIYCLPFLIPLGFGIYFLVRVLKKRSQRKKARKAALQARAAEEENPPDPQA